jgi:hypothetical protein
MSAAGGFIREQKKLDNGLNQLRLLWEQVKISGMTFECCERKQLYRTRQLLFASVCYLDAIQFSISTGVGSRGSSLVLSDVGECINLGETTITIAPENEFYREYVLETVYSGESFHHEWVPCRPLPQPEHWFERDWLAFQKGEIFEG